MNVIKKFDIVLDYGGGAIILCAPCILRRWRQTVALRRWRLFL